MTFFDIESTGKDPRKDRIVQIALVYVTKDGREEFSSLVNPGVPIDPGATEVHGITDEMVKDAPPFAAIADKVLQFIRGAVAGYNSNRFDVPMLHAEFSRCGIAWSVPPMIDVGVMYMRANPRTLSDAYKSYTGEDLEDAHDALADVNATIDVFRAMLAKHEDIPRKVQELALYCNYDRKRADVNGMLYYDDQDVLRFNFGKHKDSPCKDHADFINWMAGRDFPLDTMQILFSLLNPNP